MIFVLNVHEVHCVYISVYLHAWGWKPFNDDFQSDAHWIFFLPFYHDITVSVWIFEQLLPILWYMYTVSGSINTSVVPLAQIEWDRYLSNYSTSLTSSASAVPGEAHTFLSLAKQGITAQPLQNHRSIVFKETM